MKSLLNRISQRLQRDYFRYQYQRVVVGIERTPPLARGNAPFTLLSMMHARDLHAYLTALKSFALQLNPQRIVMVCDPSVGEAERAVIRRHVPHIELRHADEFIAPEIPRGGTWERLFAISEYVRDSYVVQLDADTITRTAIDEVAAAIAGATGFVLGEQAGQGLMTLAQTSARARTFLPVSSHIQTLTEAAMEEVGLPATAHYVRGCSGFTGFPVDADMRARLLDFSARMQGRFGPLWASWGTEQVTSNYLVANARATCVLPFPKYGTPDAAGADAAFVHFIGSMRFINDKYQQATEATIRALDAEH